MGRIGAFLGTLMFGELISSGTALPLTITGAALVAAGVAAFLLPETKDLNLA